MGGCRSSRDERADHLGTRHTPCSWVASEGMPGFKVGRFWKFKKEDIHQPPRFWAGPTEQYDNEGRRAIRHRIVPLFKEVRDADTPAIFRGREEITLSDRALAFMVSELATYDFGRTDIDAKGAAYQEIIGTNLRGDRGQYFTPRGAIGCWRALPCLLDNKYIRGPIAEPFTTFRVEHNPPLRRPPDLHP